MPWIIYPISGIIIVGACVTVMIYAFTDKTFDNFYGFSVTYLVINFLILLYGTYQLYSDFIDRFDHPNFYSAYGSPVYKYDSQIHSVV